MRAALLTSLALFPYRIRQTVLALAYLLVPHRISGLLPLMGMTLKDLIGSSSHQIPHPARALARPDGLCGLALGVDVADLVSGYSRGMFVMSHIGPLKWWAPRHRMVLFFDRARVEKATRRLLRGKRFRVSFDEAFHEVMDACATPRAGSTPLTWITPQIKSLFARAHAEGYAHSVEVWEDDRLVGGAYGLAVGRVFFTESQFHTVRDASKLGFAVLNRHLQAWGFVMNDGKHVTRYLADSGMVPVTRDEFSGITQTYGVPNRHGAPWTLDESLLDDDWKPEEVEGARFGELFPKGSQCQFSVDELLTTARSPTW